MRAMAAILALGIAAAATSAEPAAAECLPEVTAMGTPAGPAQSDAERVAWVYWRAEVVRSHGAAFGNWEVAEGRLIECIQQSPDTYLCWATAHPCRDSRLQLG